MSSASPQEQPQSSPQKRSFWDIFDDFVNSMPPEELKKLPTDGAEQHDHYIYGWPKRPNK